MRLSGIVLLSVVSFAASAQARDTYVGVYGGANFDDVIEHPTVSDNPGIVIGGVLGTSIPSVPGLYVEADVSFRQNEVDLFGGALTADHDTFTLLGNVMYAADVGLNGVKPYALLGAGYGHTEARFEDVSILSLSSAGFAWQAGAGVMAPLAPGVTAGLGYRFLQAPTIDVLGTELSDGRNHSAILELRVAL
jgi:opacity protein-like surface antigen